MASQSLPYRQKEGLGVWENRGKVAFVGIGHSPCVRRWDEKIETSLGEFAKIAALNAIADAGLTLDDIDGVQSAPGPLGDRWAPRPYLAPPFDSEDGLSMVTAEWLTKYMGLKKVRYADNRGGSVGNAAVLAIEAVASGLCNYCLVLRPLNNFEGRYHQVGAASNRGGEAEEKASGPSQWEIPYGWAGPSWFATLAQRYLHEYNYSHDNLAAFAVNNRRNGLMYEFGYYYQNRAEPLTEEDYLKARWITKPFNLYDCDIPVHTAGCFLVTTAERARHLKQRPAYILSHSSGSRIARSLEVTLREYEESAVRVARIALEGAGLTSKDIDVANLYDGYAPFALNWLEAWGLWGVKRGEGLDFLQGDHFKVGGPHPFNPSGGNIGTGRGHGTAHITDTIQQVQGRAGRRQAKKADVAAMAIMPPGGTGIVLSSHPG